MGSNSGNTSLNVHTWEDEEKKDVAADRQEQFFIRVWEGWKKGRDNYENRKGYWGADRDQSQPSNRMLGETTVKENASRKQN